MFLNGITIVLCGTADRARGATIAWATKVERDHAVVSLPKQAAVTDGIAESGTFTISVLSADQAHVARQYGGTRQSDPREPDPTDLDVDRWDVPVVKGARGQFLCKVRHTLTIKEQVVIIAEIVDTAVSDDRLPLVYRHGDYFPT